MAKSYTRGAFMAMLWDDDGGGGGGTIFEELFIFDDVKTGSATTLETLTTQYPTVGISSSVGGGFQGIRDIRALFSGGTATSVAATYPDTSKPVQWWMVSDGSTACNVTWTFQRGYTHISFYYLAGNAFSLTFYDEFDTQIYVAVIDAVAGFEYHDRAYYNMPLDGGGVPLKFRKIKFSTLADTTFFDTIYVRSAPIQEEIFRFDKVSAGSWVSQYPSVTVSASATLPNILDPTAFYAPAATNWPVNGGRKQCTLFSDGNFTITFQRDYKYIKFDYLALGWTMQLLDASNNVLTSFTPATLSGNTYVLDYAQNWAAGFRKVKFIVANGGAGFAIDNLYVRDAIV